MSKHIVYTWELGMNFGHLSVFRDLAAVLVQRGYKISIIAQDVTQADGFFDPRQIAVYQAPLCRPNGQFQRVGKELSFVDLIRVYGYMEPERLANVVRAWRALYHHLKPDMLLFNHCPTARLAARGLPLVRAALDDSFPLPPRMVPMPSVRPWMKVSQDELLLRENEVRDVCNEVLATLRMPHMKHLKHLWDQDVELLCTLPELDHYGHIRPAEARYVGASYVTTNGAVPEWPKGRYQRHVFVYLRLQHPQTMGLLNALKVLKNTAVIAVVPGLNVQQIQEIAAPHIQLYAQQMQLEPVFAKADLAITHGGTGTSSAFLLQGIPLLLLPSQLEQLLTSRAVARNGLAHAVGLREAPDFATLLPAILADAALRQRTQSFAEKYHWLTKKNQLATMVHMIEEGLESGGN